MMSMPQPLLRYDWETLLTSGDQNEKARRKDFDAICALALGSMLALRVVESAKTGVRI